MHIDTHTRGGGPQCHWRVDTNSLAVDINTSGGRRKYQWRETEIPVGGRQKPETPAEGDRNTIWRETEIPVERDRIPVGGGGGAGGGETEIQVEGDRNSDQRKLTLAPAEGDISFTGGRRQNH